MSKATTIAGLGFGTALGVAIGVFALAPSVQGNGLSIGNGNQEELVQVQQELAESQVQVGLADDLITSMQQELIGGLLQNTRVAVITTEDADPAMVDAVVAALQASEATVNARLTLTEAALGTEGGDKLKSIAAKSLPAGASLSEAKLTPGMHAGQALGSALFPDASDSDRALTVGAFSEGGFLATEGDVNPSYFAVIIAGNSAVADDAGNYSSAFLADFAHGLDVAMGGSVLASIPNSGRDNGAIDLIVNDAEMRDAISTIDNANTAVGHINVVQGIAFQKDNVAIHEGVNAS